MRASAHACIRTWMHTHGNVGVRTSMRACAHLCVHAFSHTCVPVGIHIHPWMRSCSVSHMHARLLSFMHACVSVCTYTLRMYNARMHLFTYVQCMHGSEHDRIQTRGDYEHMRSVNVWCMVLVVLDCCQERCGAWWDGRTRERMGMRCKKIMTSDQNLIRE